MMAIELVEFEGNVNIGLYSVSTNKFSIVSNQIPKNFSQTLERVLKVPIHSFLIDPSIIGALISLNNKGILLSSLISIDIEMKMKEFFPGLTIERLDFDYFALGNLIVTTDKKTLISPLLKGKYKGIIEDTLETEVISTKLNDSDLIGSMITTNSLGAVISPLVSNETEIEFVQDFLDVEKLEISTVNRGAHFPSSGILCNQNGALLGKFSTGIETIAISNALFPS